MDEEAHTGYCLYMKTQHLPLKRTAEVELLYSVGYVRI